MSKVRDRGAHNGTAKTRGISGCRAAQHGRSMNARKKRPRRWRDLRTLAPGEIGKLDELDRSLRAIQEKHHPGSIDVAAHGVSFLGAELGPDDDEL
jgi:hypothetical protein